MHIMCVRGVYVTDPAHNIIFGGNCPALSGHFSERVFSMFFCFRKFEAVAITSGVGDGAFYSVFFFLVFIG